EHRRSRRRQARVPGVSEIVAREAAPGGPRRLLPGTAVLHRVGAVSRRRHPPRAATADGPDRSPPDREVSCQRAAVEPARVPGCVELQGGRGDGAAAGYALRGLVITVRAARREDLKAASKLAAELV